MLNEEMDGEMVVSLLAMKARVDRFVAHSFAGSAGFASAAREGRSNTSVVAWFAAFTFAICVGPPFLTAHTWHACSV